MVSGAIMSAFADFAHWRIPTQIGAPDMALARINTWSFRILPFAASLPAISFFAWGARLCYYTAPDEPASPGFLVRAATGS